MKLKLNIPKGGMVFSKVTVGLHNCLEYSKDLESVYFNLTDNRVGNTNFNLFNYVFDQSVDDTYKEIECRYKGIYGPNLPMGPLEVHSDLPLYKKITSKIKFHDHIVEKIKKYKEEFNINENTLGVHLRMNGHHEITPNFGIHKTMDFINKVDEVLDTENIDNIFMASDNEESIKMMKERYGNKVSYIQDIKRAEKEFTKDWFRPIISDSSYLKILQKESVWIEVFIDVMLLGECPYFIVRTSNVSNGVMMFSKHNQKIYRPKDHYGNK